MNFISDPGLIMTVGCPGSGKSTWAEVNRTDKHLHLERDRFRTALFGSKRTYFDHPTDRKNKSNVLSGAMIGAMEQWPHSNFILSDTNLRSPIVMPILRPLLKAGVPIRVVEFHVSLGELLARNEDRSRNDWVPPEVIKDMYLTFEDHKNHWWRKYGWEVVRFAKKELANV